MWQVVAISDHLDRDNNTLAFVVLLTFFLFNNRKKNTFLRLAYHAYAFSTMVINKRYKNGDNVNFFQKHFPNKSIRQNKWY